VLRATAEPTEMGVSGVLWILRMFQTRKEIAFGRRT
jgi:hypothetical protein